MIIIIWMGFTGKGDYPDLVWNKNNLKKAYILHQDSKVTKPKYEKVGYHPSVSRSLPYHYSYTAERLILDIQEVGTFDKLN